MSPASFISSTEHKLLLTLTLLISLLFYFYCANYFIRDYNESIKTAKLAELGIHFAVDEFPPPSYTQLFRFQFFINPLLFLLILSRNFPCFSISAFLTAINNFSLLSWIKWLYDGYYYTKDDFEIGQTFSQYLHNHSEFLLLILAPLLTILFILHISIIIRFTVERFQAKISLE